MKTTCQFIVVSLAGLLANIASSAASDFFLIRVVDEQTGRGLPLVELKAVNNAAWWTDSAGFVAFNEPGLMGQEVFFHISSPGYEYPKDFFDNRGVKLRPVAGGRAKVKLKRVQIAERLYRVTGAGIYRDSVLAGERTPLRQPTLNGQVVGQDTVIATPYRGKIFWFWGDTDRASYPLGNFGASGATSELVGHGGLNPAVGVDLTYFTNAEGFSRPMCPDREFGDGLKWIEGVWTLRDESGRERLLARVAAGAGLNKTRDWHLAMFNDVQEAFESIARWDIHDTHDSAHPFRVRASGVDYLYLYPNFRVRAEVSALRDLKNYEAFTCVASDGKVRGKETVVERDAAGHVRYSWKAGADRLHAGRLSELLTAGKLNRSESWLQLIDIESGAPVEAGRGSIMWNEFLRRWVMIISGKPGEIWFSQADTPCGPWIYARRVAAHGGYNFYNPTQHPFFDEDGGRVIYFEGTYTDSFSGAPAKTPRYNYNQIMYRLFLDDPRLALPAPVYRVAQPNASPRLLLREGVEAEQAWEHVEDVEFFALSPKPARAGMVAVYSASGGPGLLTNTPTPSRKPLFFALPETSVTNAPGSAPLSDFGTGTTTPPVCRVWKNSTSLLALDFAAQAQLPLSK
jgi:hypothetical protein